MGEANMELEKGLKTIYSESDNNIQLPFMYVNFFADEKSLQEWESSTYRGLPLLSISKKEVSILNPYNHNLNIFNRYGVSQQISDVKQVSIADSNRAVLHLNGKVEADGINDYGQCNVKQLDNITIVNSINGCTLAIDNRGQVIVRGYIPFKDEIEKWQDISTIWANTRSVAAIRKDGSVLVICKIEGNTIIECFDVDLLQGKAKNAVIYESEPNKPIAVILMEDEQVFTISIGNGDKKLEKIQNKHYKTISSTKETVLLLTQDGKVDILGKEITGVKEWKEILFLSANEDCAAAIDIQRKLYITGQNYCQKALITENKWAITF